MKEKYKNIFCEIDIAPMLGAARYMLQLELLKDDAVKLQDDMDQMKYPFVETEQPSPKFAKNVATELVAALTIESMGAERIFREYLKKALEDTAHKQKEIMNESFSTNSHLLCRVVRSLKESIEFRDWETDDEELLEGILQELCFDSFLFDFFQIEELEEFDEDLTEPE